MHTRGLAMALLALALGGCLGPDDPGLDGTPGTTLIPLPAPADV
jgi:hypothetical protein